MFRKTFLVTVFSVFAVFAATQSWAAGATRVADAIWAHGKIYDTVATPTSFVSPPEFTTDVIYSFMMSGLNGQRSVAEAAPGDRDYNGGRWSVKMVSFTDDGVAALGDGAGNIAVEITSAEEVLDYEAAGYLVINDTGFYFECPMLR